MWIIPFIFHVPKKPTGVDKGAFRLGNVQQEREHREIWYLFSVCLLSQNTWDDQLQNKQKKKNRRVGLWGGGSVVKSLTVLPDDLGCIPITHIRPLTMACCSSACCSMTSCGLCGHLHVRGTHSHRQPHRHKKKCTRWRYIWLLLLQVSVCGEVVPCFWACGRSPKCGRNFDDRNHPEPGSREARKCKKRDWVLKYYEGMSQKTQLLPPDTTWASNAVSWEQSH